MNRKLDAAWMRDYGNRSQYGLDPERRYVKLPPASLAARIRNKLFWLCLIITVFYWRTR